jgi:hypothetical protein
MNSNDAQPSPGTDRIKDATITALRSILEPLFELMFDAGVSVKEFTRIAKEQSVSSASKRVQKDSAKVSKSRVAILTGLPRSEVARILKNAENFSLEKDTHQPARRILSAWHDDPRFLNATGKPALLPVFGKRQTFEQLVSKYSPGFPVRAMLDELLVLDAVELLDSQHLKAKSRVPVITGLSPRSVASIGARSRDLLTTLTHNIREVGQPLFEATAVASNVDPKLIGMIRREINAQGISFINGATSLLNRTQIKSASKLSANDQLCRVGVTIFYFQDEPIRDGLLAPKQVRRKNLQRVQKKRPAPIGAGK